METTRSRCEGTTTAGTRCKKTAIDSTKLCRTHGQSPTKKIVPEKIKKEKLVTISFSEEPYVFKKIFRKYCTEGHSTFVFKDQMVDISYGSDKLFFKYNIEMRFVYGRTTNYDHKITSIETTLKKSDTYFDFINDIDSERKFPSELNNILISIGENRLWKAE